MKDFNLKLNMGENVAIVYVSSFQLGVRLWTYLTDHEVSGKSGSGKSSVHSLLLRLYDPTAGRITFNGQGLFVYV